MSSDLKTWPPPAPTHISACLAKLLMMGFPADDCANALAAVEANSCKKDVTTVVTLCLSLLEKSSVSILTILLRSDWYAKRPEAWTLHCLSFVEQWFSFRLPRAPETLVLNAATALHTCLTRYWFSFWNWSLHFLSLPILFGGSSLRAKWISGSKCVRACKSRNVCTEICAQRL